MTDEITGGPKHLLAFQFVPWRGQGREPYGNTAYRYFFPRQMQNLTEAGKLLVLSHDLQTGIPFLDLGFHLPSPTTPEGVIHIDGFFFDYKIRVSLLKGNSQAWGDASYALGREPDKANVLNPNKAKMNIQYWGKDQRHHHTGHLWKGYPPCVIMSLWFAPETLYEFVARKKEQVAA